MVLSSITSRHFTFMWPCIVTNFIVINPTRCTNFTNLFCHETLHVSDSSSVHHQEFIHCALSSGVCHTGLKTAVEQEHMLLLESCLQTYMTYTLLSVQWISSWWWTDELSETCRVSWQNKFVKFVHLVGFVAKKTDSSLFWMAFDKTCGIFNFGFVTLYYI